MDYLPSWERVHINVHFMAVVGKNGDKYIISDSYFPRLAELDAESLSKAKFAGGSMSPKGIPVLPYRDSKGDRLRKGHHQRNSESLFQHAEDSPCRSSA